MIGPGLPSVYPDIYDAIERRYQLALEQGFQGSRETFELSSKDRANIATDTGIDLNTSVGNTLVSHWRWIFDEGDVIGKDIQKTCDGNL